MAICDFVSPYKTKKVLQYWSAQYQYIYNVRDLWDVFKVTYPRSGRRGVGHIDHSGCSKVHCGRGSVWRWGFECGGRSVDGFGCFLHPSGQSEEASVGFPAGGGVPGSLGLHVDDAESQNNGWEDLKEGDEQWIFVLKLTIISYLHNIINPSKLWIISGTWCREWLIQKILDGCVKPLDLTKT